MPTRAPSTPAYCHHKSTGRAYVRLDGRMIYLGRWNTPESRAEYDRLLGEWLAHGRRLPTAGTPGDLTVTELIAAYWQHVASYYVKNGRPTSEQPLIQAALKPVRRLYGETPVATFGPSALRACRQVLIDAGRVRKSVNRNTERIRAMFRWAVSQELVPPSVIHGLDSVVGLKRGRCSVPDPEPVRPVPDAHVDAIREHVPALVWAMIQLQRLTGMRPGEVWVMRGCDLDTTGKLWLYRPESHKTEHHGHERIVELGPKAQAVLRPFLRADTTAYLFSPRDAVEQMRARRTAQRKTPLKYGNRPGTNRKRRPKRVPRERYDRDSYRRAIARACKNAGVPHWHPHQIRHTFATEVRKQYGLETARAMLGQTTLAAAAIYAEADRAKAAEVALRIG